MDNQATELFELVQQNSKTKDSPKELSTKIISITSGKGGVGKSNISANLAYLLNKEGFRVAVFDADIGLANLDLIFGVRANKNILHLLKGEARLDEIILTINDGLYLIPGDSGDEIFKYIDDGIISSLTSSEELLGDIDFFIIDTGAGIGGITQSFLDASDMLIVVTMPDPSAITDAYATIKINSKSKSDIHMIFNMVKSEKEANILFEKLKAIAQKNMPDLNLDLLGFIQSSSSISQATRARELFCQYDRFSNSTYQMGQISKNILSKMEHNMLKDKKGTFENFLKRIFKIL